MLEADSTDAHVGKILSISRRCVAPCACSASTVRGDPARLDAQRNTGRYGFQHSRVRARRYRGLLASGEYREGTALARAEGLHPSRVAQVLDRLTLAPEMLALVDVPVERLPEGLRQADVRSLARLDHGAQGEWVARWWPKK